MKKSLCLFLFGIITTLTAQSQDWSWNVYKFNKIYPGYYVTNEGDTIEGYFKHGDKVDNQNNCHYYKNETDSKPTSKFKPADIKGYKVADKTYRTMNYSGGLFSKPLRFVLLVTDGAIAEFIFYSEDPTTPNDTKTVYHKPHDANNADPVELQSFGLKFAKKMSEYVADYPELAKKIADKEEGYGMLKILDIIKEYNDWYKKK